MLLLPKHRERKGAQMLCTLNQTWTTRVLWVFTPKLLLLYPKFSPAPHDFTSFHMFNWVCINLLSCLVVHLEGPELESGRELADRRQSEEKLLRWAQRHIRVGQLGLLDLLLLLLGGDHGQDFLRDKAGLERMHALIHTPDTCFLLRALTSMPSLFSAYSSKLTMAVLMVRGGGSTVRPMLMALLLLESKTMISWRFPSAAVFYNTKIHSRAGPPFCLHLFCVCGSVRLWGTNTHGKCEG